MTKTLIDCPYPCRKRRYSKKRARQVARLLEARDGDVMNVYKGSCGAYHVGHRYPAQGRTRRRLKALSGMMDLCQPGQLTTGNEDTEHDARKRSETD